MQINKKTLRSEHVTYLLWGYAEVQMVLRLVISGCNHCVHDKNLFLSIKPLALTCNLW